MPTESLIYVIGAGGHAKVVIDALLAGGVELARLRVADQRPSGAGATVLGAPLQSPAAHRGMAGAYFHVAIGDPATRARLHGELRALGVRPLSVVHPASVVSPHASLGEAVFVAARAVVGPGATLGDGVIVNHGAVVDHDCVVGDFSHIAPNATLGGGVQVGAQALVGAGANVLPGKQVGDLAVVGAGAVLLSDIPAGRHWAGVPAVSITKD